MPHQEDVIAAATPEDLARLRRVLLALERCTELRSELDAAEVELARAVDAAADVLEARAEEGALSRVPRQDLSGSLPRSR